MNRYSTMTGAFLLGAALLVAGQNASTQSSQNPNQPKKEAAAKKLNRRVISGDDAYKQNCTRCHSEVPKLDPNRTTTVMLHMRVRSNITKGEAKAILEYLKE